MGVRTNFIAAFQVAVLLSVGTFSKTVVVSPTCDGEPQCVTLEEELSNLDSDTELQLQAGTHLLRTFTFIHAVSNISFAGMGGGVEVACNEEVGLAFVNVSGLLVKNVIIDGCGVSGEGLREVVATLEEIFDLFYQIPSEIRVGVFLGHCENVVMEDVVVANTSGLGMVAVNTMGQSSFSKMSFLNNICPFTFCQIGIFFNSTSQYSRIGGGAFFLYQDYLTEYQALYRNSYNQLNINHGTFIENSECTVYGSVPLAAVVSEGLERLGYTIGVGAGLSIVFGHSQYAVDFTTSNSLFQNNTSTFGGGVSVGIFTYVRDSNVAFSNCSFLSNGFPIEALQQLTGFQFGGAGMFFSNDLVRFDRASSREIHDRNVSLEVSNSSFINNGALVGGGVYVYSTRRSAIQDYSDTVKFRLSKCTFSGNAASLGIALHISEAKFNGRDPGMQVEIADTVITNHTSFSFRSNFFTLSVADTPAALYAYNMNITLTGNTLFTDNTVTGLYATQSLIGIDGNITFQRNLGTYGGAMSLQSYSFLIVNRNSNLLFKDNSARVTGGALYVDVVGNLPSLLFENCFLYFDYKSFIYCSNCSDLNNTGVRIEFSGNSATDGGSTIYGTSLTHCPWATELLTIYGNTTVYDILHRYFPTVFVFDPPPYGINNIESTPVAIIVEKENESDSGPTFSAVPGQVFLINMSTYDDLAQNRPDVVSSYVIGTQGEVLEVLTDYKVSLGASNFWYLEGTNASSVPVEVRTSFDVNKNLSVVIYSTESFTQTSITVEVEHCPVGFPYVETGGLSTCTCDPRLFETGVECNITSLEFIVPDFYWVGEVEGDLAVVKCVNNYCQIGSKNVKVGEYDSQCYAPYNREGLLCGSCKENYTHIFGSNRCAKCSHVSLLIIIPFALAGIFLVWVIAFLRFTVTTGYLYGVLFYFNIVTLYANQLSPAAPVGTVFVISSWLSLKLGLELCFHDNMTNLERVAWQLMFPIYLFVLMGIMTAIARSPRCKSRAFAGSHIIQMFATLMILCYTSILESSVEILGVTRIRNLSSVYTARWFVDPNIRYFSGWHGFLCFVAIIFLLFYIIPLPILLLFPAQAYRLRYFQRLKPFYDSFWAPFNPKFRFWLAIRLFFRWIPFALQYFTVHPVNTTIVGLLTVLLLYFQLLLRPFKSYWINVWDSALLLNLVIVFLGALFYSIEVVASSDQEVVLRDQSVFTIVFVSLAYILVFCIFVYLIVQRFPRLKKALIKCYNCVRRKKECRTEFTPPPSPQEAVTHLGSDKEVPISIIQHSTETGTTVESNSGKKFVNFSELRESLLDYS